jgi:hypothetical protein
MRRRTGVTLEQRPLDLNGMEEITGIFSSPRKPSPLKQVTLVESIEEASMSPDLVEMFGMNSTCGRKLKSPKYFHATYPPQINRK